MDSYMKLRQLFNIIKDIAIENNISTPMLCGGIPRDKILGLIKNEISDIDITTGDNSVKNLSKEFGLLLGKNYSIQSRTADDGHTTVFVGSLKVDFSSNYKSPEIDKYLLKLGF